MSSQPTGALLSVNMNHAQNSLWIVLDSPFLPASDAGLISDIIAGVVAGRSTKTPIDVEIDLRRGMIAANALTVLAGELRLYTDGGEASDVNLRMRFRNDRQARIFSGAYDAACGGKEAA